MQALLENLFDLEDKIKKQREIDLKLKEWETYETYLKEIEDLKEILNKKK